MGRPRTCRRRYCAWLGKFYRAVPAEQQAKIDGMRAAGKWPPRLTYIFTNFLPMLQARGLQDAEISSILVDNPRRFFSREALPSPTPADDNRASLSMP